MLDDAHTGSDRRSPLTVERHVRMAAPAREWTDALPVGNGRLGAMVFGGVDGERVQVNDETCWTGGPGSPSAAPLVADGPDRLRAARAALAAGDRATAHALVRSLQSGQAESFQPLVDLLLTRPDSASSEEVPGAGYWRELDLRDGVARHGWDEPAPGDQPHGSGSDRVVQEVWASAGDGVLVLTRTGSRLPDVDVCLTSPHPWVAAPRVLDPDRGLGASTTALEVVVRMPSRATPTWPCDPDVPLVQYDGAATTAVVHVLVETDGTVTGTGGVVQVRGATRVRVVLTTATDHAPGGSTLHGDVESLRQEARARAWTAARHGDALRDRHVSAHRALMDRVTLQLAAGPASGAEGDDRVLQDRLVAAANGVPDPGLAALAFTFGRYLLLASSRPGGLPATLQGVWNERLDPPWHGSYTININLPMNYWGALVGALPEAHEPLLDWLAVLARSGERVARELYGAPGWVAHHNSDAWGFAAPVGDGTEDPAWSFWPLGGVWLVRHVADHWAVTGDAEALRRGWRLLESAARFLLAWLVPAGPGALGTSPATSPENTYLADGEAWSLSTSTTADLALARDLLSHVLATAPAAARAGAAVDAALVAAAADALPRLPAERVGPDGRLAEWADDVPDAEPRHRHTSHLFGVYPGTSVTPLDTPGLARAASRTLAARGAHSTGWALAWRVALQARLHDGAAVDALLRAFLHPVDAGPDQVAAPEGGTHDGGVYRSLLCAHPPFQVDGNLGVVAGIAEALAQGHRAGADGVREIHLLPALPPSWTVGEVAGLRLPGGVEVDVAWRDGVVVSAGLTLRAPTSGAETTTLVDVRDPAGVRRVALRPGVRVEVSA